MNLIRWFLLSCKRQLKHKFFTMLLVLLPFCLIGIQKTEQQDSGKIRIALYSRDDGVGQKTVERLKEATGMFEFYECSGEAQLEAAVASNQAECGYVFSADLKEKLDQGSFKRTIMVYTSPATVTADLSQEIVFSRLIQEYSFGLLENYARQSSVFEGLDRDQVWEQLDQEYQKYLHNGSTFSFEYQTVSAGPLPDTAKLTFPIRGLTAIYLFIMGMFAAVTLRRDEQKGLFFRVEHALVLPVKLVTLAAPVLLSGGAVLAALYLTGNWTGVFRETAVLLFYSGIVVIGSYLIKTVIQDPYVLSGMIPFFLVASMVFCPVFIDIRKWLSGAEWILYLCLPNYYLMFF